MGLQKLTQSLSSLCLHSFAPLLSSLAISRRGAQRKSIRWWRLGMNRSQISDLRSQNKEKTQKTADKGPKTKEDQRPKKTNKSKTEDQGARFYGKPN